MNDLEPKMHNDEVIRWMKFAITLPYRELTESCYLDKQSNELFALHCLDYLLVDENLEQSGTNTSYSPKSQALIIEKIRALELDPERFVLIDRIPPQERKALVQEFIQGLTTRRTTKHSSSSANRSQLMKNLQKMEDSRRGLLFEEFTTGITSTDILSEWETRLDTFLTAKALAMIHTWGYNPDDLKIMWLGEAGSNIMITLYNDAGGKQTSII